MSARPLVAFVSLICAGAMAALIGCQPKIAIEAPKEPITINLNVKIEHEISVKVDKRLDTLIDENAEIF